MKWGVKNESNAFKAFYASEIGHHEDFKTEKAGLFVAKQKTYLAASPDGIIMCKCHGKSTIEIKCPYKIKDKKIAESVGECDFLTLVNGEVSIKKTHKYYTQIISQMAMTNTKQSYFVVWTLKDLFVQKITFDHDHWQRVATNLEVFFKTYICPALLLTKPVTFCGICDKVLLEENEISPHEQQEFNSIQCELCICWFHAICGQVDIDTMEEDTKWLCPNCITSISMTS